MPKTKILIIDDDVVATALLKAKFDRTAVFETKTINRGTQGLTAAQQFKPDLVLLDVDMPDADGGDVACQIQADKNVGHTPILFLTSMVTEAEAGEDGLTRGGHQFMAKPVELSRLIERIRKMLADCEAEAVS